ncbi:NAD-dependent epimerase/dehydratase family protein [Microvirga sp. 2YAF29]|uniref:NAD-dependent epimerase/dehydratase family protein n=1 Tax=Microvirga sp. 2YAF29 TaxID=3233031 RepID=UPI003F99A45B
MNILVVGGTGFLGGAVARDALAQGHEVAIFTRGQKERDAVPEGIEVLVGYRHRDLSSLKDRSFDLVVDTCAFAPDAVASVLDALPSALSASAHSEA